MHESPAQPQRAAGSIGGNCEVAVLSDIHGNIWALESVLGDIAQRGINHIINLGDCLYGPLDPAGTAQRLRVVKALTVCGNEDRLIVDPLVSGSVSPTLAFVRKSLAPSDVSWLKDLPRTAVAFGELYMCHGKPDSDCDYLLKEVTETEVLPRSCEQLERLLAGVPQPVLLCGHDHISQTVRLPSRKLVVNPGSVGLQAFSDDFPFLHVMQSGSPHSHYAVLSRTAAGWDVEQVMVSYDWEAAASQACKNGRPDWARWLRAGIAD